MGSNRDGLAGLVLAREDVLAYCVVLVLRNVGDLDPVLAPMGQRFGHHVVDGGSGNGDGSVDAAVVLVVAVVGRSQPKVAQIIGGDDGLVGVLQTDGAEPRAGDDVGEEKDRADWCRSMIYISRCSHYICRLQLFIWIYVAS